MVKRKISATVSVEGIDRAKAVTGDDNHSALVERGLAALVERELERRWFDGYRRHPVGDDDLGEVPVDLSDLAWDEQR